MTRDLDIEGLLPVPQPPTITTTSVTPCTSTRAHGAPADVPLLMAFICCPQQISEWGMLSGQGQAFS